MKKTVNSLTFNTETATLLAYWDNECVCNDFNYEEQTLYVTKNGRYFIHEYGGGGTDWGRDAGNIRCGGQNIIPLSRQEAMDWCQRYGAEHAVKKHISDLNSEA